MKAPHGTPEAEEQLRIDSRMRAARALMRLTNLSTMRKWRDEKLGAQMTPNAWIKIHKTELGACEMLMPKSSRPSKVRKDEEDDLEIDDEQRAAVAEALEEKEKELRERGREVGE